MNSIAQSLPDSDDWGKGESNTPFPGQICTVPDDCAYVIVGVGVDQVRIVLSLSGEAARTCEVWTEHDYRPRGLPSMRMVGAWSQDCFKRVFRHFLGDDGPRLLYHRASAMLHVDIHFGALASVDEAVKRASAVVETLASLRIGSVFPARVARADFTGDVVFVSPAEYRYVFSALDAMLCERGRVVEPYRRSTLYISGSRSSKAKRLGRIYDKGAEQGAVGRSTVGAERYLRIEAERLWARPERPLLGDVTSEVARESFLDRFGSVGRGRGTRSGGLVRSLMGLYADGTITVAQYEQLYAFLEHERLGLARDLYPADTYRRRARSARELALEIPTDGGWGIERECRRSCPRERDSRALLTLSCDMEFANVPALLAMRRWRGRVLIDESERT